MKIDAEKAEVHRKISISEKLSNHYKEKQNEVLTIGEQSQQIYRKQAELLNEILYYSQGTIAEQSARVELEDLEQNYREVIRQLDYGQEELRDLQKKEQRKQEQLEEDLFYLRKRAEEGTHAEDKI
ncbi:hypothetical protein GIX45_25985 [Erwinia sp. CPCC 100877]|nr:hypothetical protein [Erwinia sp. CPCC 100877]